METKPAGAKRSGQFLPALVLACKAEARLFLSLAVGCVLLGLMLATIPALRPDLSVTALVNRCLPGVDDALEAWARQEELEGRNVRIANPHVDTQVSHGTDRTFVIEYRALKPSDLSVVWLWPDDDHPVPPALRVFCDARAFTFGKLQWPEFGTTWLFAWYLAIIGLVFSSSERRIALLKTAGEAIKWRFAVRWGRWGLCAAAVVFCVFLVARRLGQDMSASQSLLLVEGAGKSVMVFLLVVLVGPLSEELLFRYWLLQDFVRNNKKVLGILLVSATFAVLHLDSGLDLGSRTTQLLLIFSLSLVLCWSYLRSNNIWASVSIHVVYNWTMVLMNLFSVPAKL